MKKKLFSVLALTVLVAILVTCLVACNPYEWTAIGGGDPTAEVESNGGYFVKQGKYVYYINGFVGADADNTWGKPVQQALVRSELKDDGTIDNATTKVLAPKSIYSTSKNGGIAIFGEWVYYATPNVDKDKNGTASTTDCDFMRTKIDGSVTQLIGTINTRSAEYIFTDSRVLYFANNTISYIDFHKMAGDKNIDNGKGAEKGTCAENVAKVVWAYGCDEMYYVQNITGADSYKNYNNLVSRKLDGSNEKVLATQGTFLADGEDAVANPQKVFKFTLLDMFVEADGSATLYYTKSHTLNGTATTDGLFCAKASDVKGTEKLLNVTASTTLFPLGYAEGALAYDASNVYCWFNGENAQNPIKVTSTSQTVWAVDQEAGVAYFTATSSAKDLYKISYKEAGNATIVMSEGIKTDWLKLEFVGDDFYFFASDDSNYLHTINVKTFDKNEEDAKSVYVGFEREEDDEEEDK